MSTSNGQNRTWGRGEWEYSSVLIDTRKVIGNSIPLRATVEVVRWGLRIKQIGLPLRGRPILLITRMITPLCPVTITHFEEQF